MILFGKQNSVIYLKRQGIEIYLPGKTGIVFNFASELVASEEIINKEKLRVQLVDFLKSNKLTKLQTVVVLGEELIYQKDISATDPVGINAEKEKFVNEIPFSSEKIVVKAYPDKNLILAVNGELFKLLIEEITRSGGNVSFVVPQTLLGTPTINAENFRQILANNKLLKIANLLKEEEKKNINLKLIVIVVIVLVGLLASGGFYYFKISKNPPKKEISKSSVREKAIVNSATDSGKISTVSAVINQKTKKDLTVKIFNGTGTAGDAKKVKDSLLALGFQNVETDNLEMKNATQSAIIYSISAVSYLPEITTALRKIFSLEPLSVSTNSASFDLQITTGK